MDDEPRWTIEELVRRAAIALTGSAQSGDYPGAPNGRVRELPDQRVVRWYASIGLVDRPSGGRGRVARYGLRHLRQLVAVKRLQGQGLALAEIQGRLAGVVEAELERLAPLPPAAIGVLPPAPPIVPMDVERRPMRFWAAPAPTHEEPSRPGLESAAGVRLAPGVLLLLPSTPSEADLAALGEAAGPLLTCLVDRGLVSVPAHPAGPVEGASR